MAIPEQRPVGVPWHEDVNERKRIGQRSERSFPREWGCKCGGLFAKNTEKFGTDFKCNKCGQPVDPKSGKDAHKYGWLTVSQIPFEKYTDDTIIVWDGLPEKPFTGVKKKDAIVHPDGPFKPTHKSNPTWFHKIKLDNFQDMEEFGFVSRLDELPF